METEYRWFISGGKPRLINNPTMPDTEFHGSAMAVENYIDPTTGKEASAAKSKFSPPIPDRNFKSFRGMWHVKPNFNNGKPYTGFMLIPEPMGAFRNAVKLKDVYIAESVKFIGAESFRFTALKTVKIAADCEYSETSFPEGCEVEFYGGGGTYGQLYDCDGKAILDYEGARIYVRSDKREDKK